MCVCGEGEVLVFMYKGVFVVDGVTVGGKVAWLGGMRLVDSIMLGV